MINHRRWPALLLCAAMTLSSVSVLAMAGETPKTGSGETVMTAQTQSTKPADSNEADKPLSEDEEVAERDGAEVESIDTTETDEPAETEEGETEEPEQTEEPEPEPEPPADDPNALKIVLNGELLHMPVAPVIINGNTFLSLRAFAEAMGCTVQWSPSGLTTVTRGSELKLEVQAGSDLICANERYFYMPEKAVSVDGILMVPVRGIAKVFTFTVEWIQASSTVSLTGGQPLEAAEAFYNADDLLWLSRIIHAESRGEPLEGKIAVGNVVINRTKSAQFPDTIYDVIFDKKNGTQFTPTRSGSIYNTPNEESVLAAKLCLEGHSEVSDALYFLSTSSKSGWITRTRTLVAKIGNHMFYS